MNVVEMYFSILRRNKLPCIFLPYVKSMLYDPYPGIYHLPYRREYVDDALGFFDEISTKTGHYRVHFTATCYDEFQLEDSECLS